MYHCSDVCLLRFNSSGIISFLVGAFTCAHLGLVTLGRTTIENKIYHAWDLTRPQHERQFKFQRSNSQKLPAEKTEENRERDMEEGRVEKKEEGRVEEKDEGRVEKKGKGVAKTEKSVRLPETFTLTGKNLYNNGVWYNWRDVMGPNVLLWFSEYYAPLRTKRWPDPCSNQTLQFP